MTLKLAKIQLALPHVSRVVHDYVPYWTDGHLISGKTLWLGWTPDDVRPEPTAADWASMVGLDLMDDDRVRLYRHVVQGTPHYVGQVGTDVFGAPGHGPEKDGMAYLNGAWYLNYHEDSDGNNATNRLDLYFRTEDEAFIEALKLGAARYQEAPTHRSPVFTCEVCGITRWLGSRGPIPTHCRACRAPSQKA